jgi:RimJ/RimL family protein N-acetyltransferase
LGVAAAQLKAVKQNSLRVIDMATLETKRLLLRKFQDSDLDDFAAICADPDVMRFASITGNPLTRAQAWNWIAMVLGHWELRGYGLWAVELRGSGTVIGRIGIHYPEGWPDLELGWMLGKSYWGQGYATEGATASLNYAFTKMNFIKVISLIHPDNVRSIRLAERIGEHFEKEIDMFDHRLLMYSVYQDDWSSA